MRSAALALLAVLTASSAAAGPAGGALLLSLTHGEAGELTQASEIGVSTAGLQNTPTVLAAFELPPNARGVYAALAHVEADTVVIERGFSLRLVPPSGEQWVIAGVADLGMGACPAPGPCRWDFADGAGPSTELRPAQAGSYRVLAYGLTNAEYRIDVRTT